MKESEITTAATTRKAFVQLHLSVVLAGFRTNVLPHTIQRGAIQPTGIIAGKFHGAIPANTPSGSL